MSGQPQPPSTKVAPAGRRPTRRPVSLAVVCVALAAGVGCCQCTPPPQPSPPGGQQSADAGPVDGGLTDAGLVDAGPTNEAWLIGVLGKQFLQKRGTTPDPACATGSGPGASPGTKVLWTLAIPYDVRSGAFIHWPWLYLGGTSLMRIDIRTGALKFARDALIQSQDANLALGADGKLYGYGTRLTVMDPMTMRILRNGFGPEQDDTVVDEPLVLPDGRVVDDDVYGYLFMLKPTSDGTNFTQQWVLDINEQLMAGDANGFSMIYDLGSNVIVVPITELADTGTASAATIGVRPSDGKVLWSAPGGGHVALLPGGLFVRDDLDPTGTAFQASGYREGLEIRNVADGSLVRALSSPGRRGGLPVVASTDGKRIYWVHRPRSDFGSDPEHGKTTANGAVMAFDGNLRLLWVWHVPGGPMPDGQPVVISRGPVVSVDDSVTVQAYNCSVYHLDRNGHLLWSDRSPYMMGGLKFGDASIPLPAGARNVVVALSASVWNPTDPVRVDSVTVVKAYDADLQGVLDGGVSADGGTDAGP